MCSPRSRAHSRRSCTSTATTWSSPALGKRLRTSASKSSNSAVAWLRSNSAVPHDSLAPGGSTRGWLWIFRGANLARWGKLKAAHRCYRTALTLECARDEAYLNLGYIYRAEGRYGEAIRCFQRALAIDPEYQLAQSALLSLEGFDELSAMAEDFS